MFKQIMASYNKLSDLVVNPNITSWHFKVKLIRVFSYDILGDQYWCYILADEDGTKTSMVIYPSEAYKFERMKDAEGNWVDKKLQDQEGKWVEIFRVNVESAFTGFKPVDSPFRLTVHDGTQIRPIAPLNNNHYLDLASIGQIRFKDMDTPTDVMGVVFNMQPLEVFHGDRAKTELVFYIKDNMNDAIKCVARGDSAYAFRDANSNTRGMGVAVVVLRMWRICKYLIGDEEPWLETHGNLSDFRFNLDIEEVADFRRAMEHNEDMMP